MLRLLRKTRRKSIDEGNLKIYSLYAVGEILLVVIGILLAFQVDNWNQERKAINQEKRILQDLKNEFKINLNILNSVMDEKTEIMRNGKLFLKHTGINANWDSNLDFDSLLVKTIVSGWVFNPETGVLTDILNSGKLDLIQNDSLRYIIASIEAYTDRLQNEDDVVKQDLHNMYLPFLSNIYPIRNTNAFESAGLPLDQRELADTGPSEFEASPDILLRNNEFENLINIQLLWVNFSLFHYKFQKAKYEEALELINRSLNSGR